MGIATGIAIYFLIWWVVLFAVLPWGVRAQGDDARPGSDPGRAAGPRGSGCSCSGPRWRRRSFSRSCVFVYLKGLVTLDDLARLLGMPQFEASSGGKK